MPFFVKVSDHHCRKFLSCPNTYNVRFPRGCDFFFSLPLDMDSLFRMRPDELFALHSFLPQTVKDKTAAEIWNMRDVQVVISRRLTNAKGLGPVERHAWAAGHGYPVFDINNFLTGFSWNWKLIEFEGGKDLVFMYMYAISDQNRQQATNRTATEEAATILCWEKNEHEAFVCQRHGQAVCFYIYGAYFRDFVEWEHVEAKLTEQELDELDRGLLILRNRPGGGYNLVSVEFEEEQGSRRRLERRHGSDTVASANKSNHSAPRHSFPCDQECYCTIFLTVKTPYHNTPTRRLVCEHTTYKQPPIKHTNTAKYSDTDTNNLINVYGAIFEGENDWLAFASTLTNVTLYFLSHGILNLQGCTHNGIVVTWDPQADARLEEIDDEDSTDHHSYRDNHEQQPNPTSSANTLERLYQANLPTHTTLSHVCNRNIRRCTQPLDFALPRVYRGVRDDGALEEVATKQLLQLKAMELQRSNWGKNKSRPSVGSVASCFFDEFEQDGRDKHEQETSGFDCKDSSSGGNNKHHHEEHSKSVPCPQTPLASASTYTNLYTASPARHPSTQIQPTYNPFSAQKMQVSSTARQDKKPKYQAYAEESPDELHQVRAAEGSWRDV